MEFNHPSQQSRLAEWNVSRSVDIHCHCLPGLDDGPRTMGAALALCEALVADGLTTVFATPHQLGRYDRQNSAVIVRTAIANLQRELAAAHISLEIVPGADVRIDERLARLLAADEVLPAGPKRKHLLLELPNSLYVEPLTTISELAAQGVQVVMTHPERHRYLAGSNRRLQSWIEAGAAIQITAGSLTGEFGAPAHEEAWRLVRAGMVSLVATDAHSADGRPPCLTAALDLLSQHCGREYARTVCLTNPLQVWEGKPIVTRGAE